MSNLSENRINVVIAPADITAINTSVATILSKIPANTTLTDEQRLSYNAINVANKVFAEDCLVEAQLNGAGIVPGFVNLPNMQNDLTVFDQLDQMESALNNALQRIADAKRIHINLVLVKLLELHHLGYDLRHYHAQHHAFIKQLNLPEYYRFDAAG